MNVNYFYSDGKKEYQVKTTLLTSVGLVFLFLPILFYSRLPLISQIGSLCLIFVYLIVLRDTVSYTITLPINTLSLSYLAFALWAIVCWGLRSDISALYNLGLCIAGLYVIYFFSRLTISKDNLKNLFFIASYILAILLPLGIYMGFHGGIGGFKGYDPYLNKVIFKLILPLSFFIALQVKRKIMVWAPLAIIYFHMSERTSALALLLIVLAYYIFPIIKGQTNRIRWIFFAIIIAILLFNAVYIWLYSTDYGKMINEQIRESTSKNFFSGRQNIWKVSLELVADRPIFGYGFSPDILEQQGISLSTHNAYIYVLLHTGVSGLVLFLAFLYSLWKYCCENWNQYSRITLAYLAALLIFINFELTVIANTMVNGMFHSLVIGIGISMTNTKHKSNIDNNIWSW